LKLFPILLLGACGLLAQDPASGLAPAQVKQRLAEIQLRLGTVDQQLTALKKRRKGVLVELQAISLQADRVRAQAEQARLQRDQTQLDVTALTARQGEIHQEIEQRRGELRRQVRWLQALGPLGNLAFFANLTSFQQFVTQGRYQAYLRNQQRRRLDQIQALQDELVRRQGELREALGRLAQQQQEAVQTSAALKLQEDHLQEFLDGLAQDENRQKEVHADLAEEALQLERMLTQLLAKPRSDAFETSVAFAGLHGDLPQPVVGTLALGFGEHLHPRFHTKTMQTGLLIASDPGAAVHAVADGKVVYVDLYQSFGPMVILDHGSGFFSLYTHLQGLAVAKGQILKQGEPVGAVGVTMDGPRLGFEIRHLTQPQDPNPWFKQKYRLLGEPKPVAKAATRAKGR
jgi:septal ring factor EnvC (AmiA/AmiB activator)